MPGECLVVTTRGKVLLISSRYWPGKLPKHPTVHRTALPPTNLASNVSSSWAQKPLQIISFFHFESLFNLLFVFHKLLKSLVYSCFLSCSLCPYSLLISFLSFYLSFLYVSFHLSCHFFTVILLISLTVILALFPEGGEIRYVWSVYSFNWKTYIFH